jgi:hypothetical protein
MEDLLMKWLPVAAALVIMTGFGFALGSRAEVASADGSWMDGTPQQWNVAGSAIPLAPASEPALDENIARCGRDERWPETEEDDAVLLAGWRLFGSYQAGWGVKVIQGLAGYDGMCRPVRYQEFVFVDGVFAGTVSPEPMDSRTDGAATSVRLLAQDRIMASFVRYTDADPLCCPSRTTSVSYRVDRTDAGPVLVPESSFTQPTS